VGILGLFGGRRTLLEPFNSLIASVRFPAFFIFGVALAWVRGFAFALGLVCDLGFAFGVVFLVAVLFTGFFYCHSFTLLFLLMLLNSILFIYPTDSVADKSATP